MTLFICLEDDAKKWKTEIASAKKKGIPVVNEHYLIDALNSGSKPASTKKYVVVRVYIFSLTFESVSSRDVESLTRC